MCWCVCGCSWFSCGPPGTADFVWGCQTDYDSSDLLDPIEREGREGEREREREEGGGEREDERRCQCIKCTYTVIPHLTICVSYKAKVRELQCR